jgi:Trypsin-like peptidase domain
MNLYAYRRPFLSTLGRLSLVAGLAWSGVAGAQPAVPVAPNPPSEDGTRPWAEPPPSPPVEAASSEPTEATPPAPKASSSAEVTTPAPKACAEGWKKRTYRATKASLVRIEPIGMSVSQLVVSGGFVYPTGRHVVTHSDADNAGRGVWVIFADGRKQRAHLSAIDRENDLALFEIEGAASAPSLELSSKPLEAGAEVMALQRVDDITNEGDAVLDTRLQVGHVANDGGKVGFRFDGPYGSIVGSTVFDCDGKIVALRWGNLLVPAQKVRELLSPKASSAIAMERGHWSAGHVHAGALMHFGDGRFYGGLGLGMSLVNDDRWQVRFGFGGTLSADPKKEGQMNAGRTRTFGRLQLETSLGYRFLMSESVPIYFVPQIGVVGRWNLKSVTDTRYVAEDPACFAAGGGSCEVKPTVDQSTTHRFGALPTVGASVLIHALGLGYQYQIDTKDSKRSTHQIFVGLEF